MSDIQNLSSKAIKPLTLLSKTNEIIDTVNEQLNTSYSEKNSLLTSVEGICTWVVTHNLGTEEVLCTVYEGDDEVLAKVEITSENSITIVINSSVNIPAETYSVLILAKGGISNYSSQQTNYWIESSNTSNIYSGSNTESQTISLTSILPEGYSQYEVTFVTQIIATKGTLDNYINAEFTTQVGSFSFGACKCTNTDINSVAVTTTTVPVGSNRTIQLKARVNDKGTINISVRAYKIVG